MGTVDPQLATALRDRLGLRRAVETGTYRGLTARVLAPLFERVITVELSRDLHARAAVALSEFPNVEAVQGHSPDVLSDIAAAHTPTLYFLDGHWSAGNTVGAENECPLLDELAAIGAGHPHDCLIIDDARLFTSAPPPPHDCAQWPTIEAIFDAVRLQRPQHMVTVLSDQVIAVPSSARCAIDEYGARVYDANKRAPKRLLDRLVAVGSRVTRAS